jgi:hypothetical protein
MSKAERREEKRREEKRREEKTSKQLPSQFLSVNACRARVQDRASVPP